MTSWRHPGRTGALVYAVVGTLLGGVITMFSRLQMARHRGRRAVASKLPDGPLIIVANHTSYADGLLLMHVCRRMGRSVRLLATSGVFRAPVIGRIVRRLGFIPVERGSIRAAGALDAAVDAILAGEAVGIFPEGRTTRDPDRWPERAKTGVVRLALRTGAPVVPVALVGAHRVLDRGRMVGQLVRNVVLRPRVATAVGAPIDVARLVDDPADRAQIRAATDAVMAELIALIAQLRDELPPPASSEHDAPTVDPDG